MGADARQSAGAGGVSASPGEGRESGGKRTSRGSGTIRSDPTRPSRTHQGLLADQLAELHALSGGRDAASQRSVLAGGQGAAMGQGDETTSAPERGRNNNNRGWARGRELARGRGGGRRRVTRGTGGIRTRALSRGQGRDGGGEVRPRLGGLDAAIGTHGAAGDARMPACPNRTRHWFYWRTSVANENRVGQFPRRRIWSSRKSDESPPCTIEQTV